MSEARTRSRKRFRRHPRLRPSRGTRSIGSRAVITIEQRPHAAAAQKRHAVARAPGASSRSRGRASPTCYHRGKAASDLPHRDQRRLRHRIWPMIRGPWLRLQPDHPEERVKPRGRTCGAKFGAEWTARLRAALASGNLYRDRHERFETLGRSGQRRSAHAGDAHAAEEKKPGTLSRSHRCGDHRFRGYREERRRWYTRATRGTTGVAVCAQDGQSVDRPCSASGSRAASTTAHCHRGDEMTMLNALPDPPRVQDC